MGSASGVWDPGRHQSTRKYMLRLGWLLDEKPGEEALGCFFLCVVVFLPVLLPPFICKIKHLWLGRGRGQSYCRARSSTGVQWLLLRLPSWRLALKVGSSYRNRALPLKQGRGWRGPSVRTPLPAADICWHLPLKSQRGKAGGSCTSSPLLTSAWTFPPGRGSAWGWGVRGPWTPRPGAPCGSPHGMLAILRHLLWGGAAPLWGLPRVG